MLYKIIILIILLLIIFKQWNYFVSLKFTKIKSKFEVVFLIVFFLFLFVPIIDINQNKISYSEKRYLAEWKPLINQELKINYNFGNDFDNWFRDRFFLRRTFINFRNTLMLLIGNRSDIGVLDKSTKTFYSDINFVFPDIQTIKYNFKSLYLLNDYCKQHNIKLYTLVVPVRLDIHKTKYNFINNDDRNSDFLNYIHKLQQENEIKVIYPYETMKKSADLGSQLYFKTDAHWTDDGAFIAYQELIKIINKDFHDIVPLTIDKFDIFYDKKIRSEFQRDFNFGQDCYRMAISNKMCKYYHNYDYRYYKHKDFDNLNVVFKRKNYYKGKSFYYSKAPDYRVVLIGNSQCENLSEFIPFTFRNVKRIRNTNVARINRNNEFKILKYYEKEILDYKPDIIILSISPWDIPLLKTLIKKE